MADDTSPLGVAVRHLANVITINPCPVDTHATEECPTALAVASWLRDNLADVAALTGGERVRHPVIDGESKTVQFRTVIRYPLEVQP